MRDTFQYGRIRPFSFSLPAQGDVDGDLTTDYVVTTATGTTLYNSIGGTPTSTWTSSDLTLGRVETALGDFNGDGKTDLVALTPRSLSIYPTDSTGQAFDTVHPFYQENGDPGGVGRATTWASQIGIDNLSIADFNGDQKAGTTGLSASAWAGGTDFRAWRVPRGPWSPGTLSPKWVRIA